MYSYGFGIIYPDCMEYWDLQTIEQIRKGFYSALYFNRTKQILLKENNVKKITMQIFQKNEAILCGSDQVLALLKRATGYFVQDKWVDMSDHLTVETLSDGESISPWESVMHIKGPYAYFAHLESLYLGILARSTLVATNVHHVVKAAAGKQVMFFADRFDYFLTQEIDGYAAHIGGAHGVATAAQAVMADGKVVGTIPHSLIAVHTGDTLTAAESFVKEFPEVPLIVLVDFDNDCVTTALAVARKFKEKLFAVRLDTSEKLIDASLHKRNDNSLTGVNAQLVYNVRKAMDAEGFLHVKIVVSGGFTAEKVSQFEKDHVPVDIYGVGSSLLRGSNDFTADCVQVEGENLAKVGRTYTPNKRLCIKSLSI